MLAGRYRFGAQVRLLDGGTQGLYLINQLEGIQHLIIFDAVDFGLPPGTLKVARNDEVPQFLGAKALSLHQVGFQDVLAMAALLGKRPPQMLLIGVQPHCIDDYGGSLSTVVRAMLEPALDRALAELAAQGVRPETAPDPGSANDGAQPYSALALDHYEHDRPSPEQACRHGDARFLAAAALRSQ